MIWFILVDILLTSTAEAEQFPKFQLVSQYHLGNGSIIAPEIHVQFDDGYDDILSLEKVGETSCNYLGFLKNSEEESSVAVTGCLKQPEDKLSITLLSKHNKGWSNMFSVDSHGNTEYQLSPFRNDSITKSWDIAFYGEGQEPTPAAVCSHPSDCVLPKKLKAVIQRGYDKSLKEYLESINQNLEDWMDEVLTHTRAHFKHPTLTTQVEFEVLPSVLYHDGVWTADDDIADAASVTLNEAEDDADAVVWLVKDTELYGVLGVAYVAGLCRSSIRASISEMNPSVAATGEIVSHELGHSFGMRHDFDHKDESCKGIMDYNKNDAVWSECSVKDFKQTYHRKNWGTNCLEVLASPPPAKCIRKYIDDKYCDDENNVAECDFDGGDCCEEKVSQWNRYCKECECKSGSSPSISVCQKKFIGDNYCDDNNNVAECNFDGGDCCDKRISNWNAYCNDCECKD